MIVVIVVMMMVIMIIDHGRSDDDHDSSDDDHDSSDDDHDSSDDNHASDNRLYNMIMIIIIIIITSLWCNYLLHIPGLNVVIPRYNSLNINTLAYLMNLVEPSYKSAAFLNPIIPSLNNS